MMFAEGIVVTFCGRSPVFRHREQCYYYVPYDIPEGGGRIHGGDSFTRVQA